MEATPALQKALLALLGSRTPEVRLCLSPASTTKVPVPGQPVSLASPLLPPPFVPGETPDWEIICHPGSSNCAAKWRRFQVQARVISPPRRAPGRARRKWAQKPGDRQRPPGSWGCLSRLPWSLPRGHLLPGAAHTDLTSGLSSGRATLFAKRIWRAGRASLSRTWCPRTVTFTATTPPVPPVCLPWKLDVIKQLPQSQHTFVKT